MGRRFRRRGWCVVGLAGAFVVGCGDGRDESPVSGSAGLSESAGDGGSGASGGDGDDGRDGGSDSGDSTGDSGPGGGESVACGEPQQCEQPAPPTDCGMASHVPFGCGGSSFELAWSWNRTGGGAKAIPVVGDIDGDGAPDLVLNPRKIAVMVFAGVGDGTFGGPQNLLNDTGGFHCGWGPDLGDFSGDGLLDVVIGDHCLGPLAWKNDGGMSFSPARAGLPTEDFVSGCGTAEISGDGNLDLVCGADQFGRGFVVAFGDGAGNWTKQSITGMPAYAAVDGAPTNTGHFQFADYDDDGDLDVFASGQRGTGGMSVFVYRNDDGGTAWSQAAVLDGGYSNPKGGVVVHGSIGDVNCDGFIDVAAGGTIHLGSSAGWTSPGSVDGAKVSHFGDFNGDGYLDLVTHLNENPDMAGHLRLYYGDGSGTVWTAADVGLPHSGWVPEGTTGIENSLAFDFGIDIADLNGDGRLDIVRWYELLAGGLEANLEAWVQVG